MSSSPELILYHYYRSSSSWRVRWALAHKQLAVRLVHVDLLAGEHKQAAYLKKNPLGLVPCLQIDGGECVGESLAIIEWLEERFPTPALLPSDSRSRLRVRSLCNMIACDTQPLQNLAAQRYFSSDRYEQLRYARHWIHQGLAAYERVLVQEQLAGSFSFGHALTMADLCLIPQCYNAERFGVRLSEYPTIERIYRHCLQTESCRGSAPDRYGSST